jgi:UDP-2,3-diacylglucosamine pyrophosphatase LpxH
VRTFKENLPCAVRHIDRYESSCASLAAEADCTAVVCGHIHLPRMREIAVGGKPIQYRNSGDWVEHCSALELNAGIWKLVDASGQAFLEQSVPSQTEPLPEVLAQVA